MVAVENVAIIAKVSRLTVYPYPVRQLHHQHRLVRWLIDQLRQALEVQICLRRNQRSGAKIFRLRVVASGRLKRCLSLVNLLLQCLRNRRGNEAIVPLDARCRRDDKETRRRRWKSNSIL